MKEHSSRLVGAVSLAVLFGPIPLYGQSPIALKPIPVQATNFAADAALLPTLPALPVGRPITLENIPKAEDAVALPIANEPKTLSVKPIALETQITKEKSRRKLSVDEMINRSVTSVDVLSRLNTMKGLDAGASLAPDVRMQNLDPNNQFDWTPAGFCWESPAFCYSPLYFEQPNLERYGNGKGRILTPALSATYFFGQVVVLPVTSVCQPPWSKQCTLGHHRPGDCAPFQRRPYRQPSVVNSAQPMQYAVNSVSLPTEEVVSRSMYDNLTQNNATAPAVELPQISEQKPAPNDSLALPVVVSTNWKPLTPPSDENVSSSKPTNAAEGENTAVVRQISFR